MKSAPLYIVRYFKGEETRTLSKHLKHDSAFKVANRFIHNLRDKINSEAEEPVLIAITCTKIEDTQQTLFSLTNRAHGPTGEGVQITLESQPDPNWDYAQYSDPCSTDSGHVATATGHQGWPFTVIPQ